METVHTGKSSAKDDSDRIWKDIRHKAESLSYGSVTITVHDGKIVQVETNTKTRYA